MCDENRITNEEFCRKLELLNSKSNKSDQSFQQCGKQSNSKIDGRYGNYLKKINGCKLKTMDINFTS